MGGRLSEKRVMVEVKDDITGQGQKEGLTFLDFHVSRTRPSDKVSTKMKMLDWYQIMTSDMDCRTLRFLFNVNCVMWENKHL
jgi:hypothetical protein